MRAGGIAGPDPWGDGVAGKGQDRAPQGRPHRRCRGPYLPIAGCRMRPAGCRRAAAGRNPPLTACGGTATHCSALVAAAGVTLLLEGRPGPCRSWRRRQAPSPPWRAGSRPGRPRPCWCWTRRRRRPLAGRLLAIALPRTRPLGRLAAARLGAALEPADKRTALALRSAWLEASLRRAETLARHDRPRSRSRPS